MLDGLRQSLLHHLLLPVLPGTSAPDLERSSPPATLWGVCIAAPVDALGNLASSSSLISMVLTSVLAIAMSTNMAGATLFLFFFFFFDYAAWVAAMVVAARNADILPAVCHVL